MRLGRGGAGQGTPSSLKPFASLMVQATKTQRIVEQVPDRPPAKSRPPARPSVLGRVMDHITTLAESRQIAWPVIARIMIQMGTGQNDAGQPDLTDHDIAHRNSTPRHRPPALLAGIPPAAIAQMRHPLQMRARAPLAASASPSEPDGSRHLRPVDRIKPAMLGADRHRESMIRGGE